MAYLLGGEAIMDSLQTDVRDLQWAITDVLSRSGPVQCPSWKFPDKMSCELDIDDLLDLYSYSEEEEESQVAHIALYELVIDRFVLLIQAMTKYTDQLLSDTKAGGETSHTSSSSVGLIVKRFWNHQVQLHTVIKQTMSDIKSKSRKLSDLESNISKLTDELNKVKSGVLQPKSPGFGGLIPPNNAELAGISIVSPSNLEFVISKDEYNKATQTLETAFLPCEACGAVQKCFKQTGEIVIGMCQLQQLPSSLHKFRPRVAGLDWLSAIEVTRWTAEQNKDLARLKKHLENLVSTLEPLKLEVLDYEKKCKQQERKIANFDTEMKKEKEIQVALQHQSEVKVKNMENKLSETVSLATREKEGLFSSKQELEKRLEQHRAELERQKCLLLELETTKSRLQAELNDNNSNQAQVKQLEVQMSSLKSRLDDVTGKLDITSKDLTREQGKNRSASKHAQSLQSKQEALLQQIDALDRENTDLRDQAAELEEEKEHIEESLKKAESEVNKCQNTVKQYEMQLENLATEKDALEQSISELNGSTKNLEHELAKAQEQEKLLVEYPDLHGPVNPDYEGTGDIATDMENQIKANSVRIQILEEENQTLRNSITKVLYAQPLSVHIKPAAPVPLWNKDSLETAKTETRHKMSDTVNHNQSQLKYTIGKRSPSPGEAPFARPSSLERGKTFDLTKTQQNSNDEFLVGKGSRPPSASRPMSSSKMKDISSRPSRPSSGKNVMAPANVSSISAYLQMKNVGHFTSQKSGNKGASRPQSGKMGGYSNNDSTKHEAYTCELCDRTYTRARDLEIHKSYCTP